MLEQFSSTVPHMKNGKSINKFTNNRNRFNESNSTDNWHKNIWKKNLVKIAIKTATKLLTLKKWMKNTPGATILTRKIFFNEQQRKKPNFRDKTFSPEWAVYRRWASLGWETVDWKWYWTWYWLCCYETSPYWNPGRATRPQMRKKGKQQMVKTFPLVCAG